MSLQHRHIRIIVLALLLLVALVSGILVWRGNKLPSSGESPEQSPKAEAISPSKNADNTMAAPNSQSASYLLETVLENINKSIASNGAGPVSLDEKATKAAQTHCEDMARNDFFGHISLDGSRPLHRYNFTAGGEGHIAENVALLVNSTSFEHNDDTLLEIAAKGHDLFMAETAPSDSHRKNILDIRHNQVGIGLAVVGHRFTYCEEFVDRYMAIYGPADKNVASGTRVVFTGRVLSPNQYGMYIAAITFDTVLVPPSDPKAQPHLYSDRGSVNALVLPPWELAHNGNSYNVESGDFVIAFTARQPGYYYALFYLRDNPSTIPYDHADNASSADGFPGGAQIIRVY
jgi:uncharacterized protein YkwD